MGKTAPSRAGRRQERKSTDLSTRWAVWYAVAADARFLSHHDAMRLWERASARAGLDLKFTRGFNPRPRLSFPLARPVGVAGRRELLTLEFARPTEPASWAEGLARQLPPGWSLVATEPLAPRGRVRVKAARYEMLLETAERAAVKTRLAELMPMQQWRVRRPGVAGEAGRVIDIKDCIDGLGVGDGKLSFAVLGERGPAGPADVLRLLGWGGAGDEEDPGPAALAEAMARLTRTEIECEF